MTEAERKYFSKLTKDYITDESDSDSSDSHITVHKHTWRSQSKLYLLLESKIMLDVFVQN